MRSMSGDAERERLRDELLERVRTTAAVFYEAAAENARAVTKFSDMLDHPDGAHAVLQSARRERDAMQDYHRSLQALCDFLNLK